MKKFPFHQKGILAVQQQLYALTDKKLATEVFTIRKDFREWIKTKFDLSLDELDYLNKLNAHFIEYAAIKSSNFLAQRKPIQFSIIEFKPESQTQNIAI